MNLREVVDKNLGRYVPPRFSKIGSPEWIFRLENGVPEQIFATICVPGAKNFRHIRKYKGLSELGLGPPCYPLDI